MFRRHMEINCLWMVCDGVHWMLISDERLRVLLPLFSRLFGPGLVEMSPPNKSIRREAHELL